MLDVSNFKNTVDGKEIKKVKDSVLKRLKTIDKLSLIVENTLDESDVLGNPLTLAPGSEEYTDVMELYIKLIKANKDLVESFRKLKITEFDIRDKEEKIKTMNTFLLSIDGKTPENIRTEIKNGTFAPINLALASLIAEGVAGDPNASRAVLQGMADWGNNESFDSEVPQLTVNLNLSEDEKNRMIKNGEDIRDTINITPED